MKRLTNLTLAAALILSTTTASVESETFKEYFTPEVSDFSVTFGGWSIHTKSEGMNENQHVTGLEYKNLGYMRLENSYGIQSNAVYYTWNAIETSCVSLRLRTGLVTGYEDTPEGIEYAPFVEPYVAIRPFKSDLGLDAGFIPTPDCGSSLEIVYLFNLRYDF